MPRVNKCVKIKAGEYEGLAGVVVKAGAEEVLVHLQFMRDVSTDAEVWLKREEVEVIS